MTLINAWAAETGGGQNKWVLSLLQQMGNVCDNVKFSGRPFHVWAAATLRFYCQ